MCLCFCLLSPRVYFSNEFFFFFNCDGSNHKNPPGNKLCEGSSAKRAAKLATRPIAIVWFETQQPKSLGNIFGKDPLLGPSAEHQAPRAVLLPSSWA